MGYTLGQVRGYLDAIREIELEQRHVLLSTSTAAFADKKGFQNILKALGLKR